MNDYRVDLAKAAVGLFDQGTITSNGLANILEQVGLRVHSIERLGGYGEFTFEDKQGNWLEIDWDYNVPRVFFNDLEPLFD